MKVLPPNLASSYRLRTLLKGDKAINIDTAIKLSCIFPEHPARDWLDMQTAHDLNRAYEHGKMNAIAREMGVPTRNVSMLDWMNELSRHYGTIRVPLGDPVIYKVNALCEKLQCAPVDVALKAIDRFWQQMDQEKD